MSKAYYTTIASVHHITGIDPSELEQSTNRLHIARARQMIMYVLRNRYGMTASRVASIMGLSGHSRVIHSCTRLQRAMGCPVVKAQVEYLMKVVVY